MDLQEKQYELGGVVFGTDCPVEVKEDGWQPGGAALRTQDMENPTGDGVRMGRDFKGSSTWGFSLYTNGTTENEAWDAAGQLGAVWDDNPVRLQSGDVVPLRYCVGGKTRVLYGRPRRWTPTPTNLSLGGRIDIEADFVTVDHRFYSETQQSQRITLGVPLELDAGLDVPFIPPFTTDAGSATRQDSITIGGEVATPISITFYGPVDNAEVFIGDWQAALEDPVEIGDPVTIDARPWVTSATKQSGGGVRVSPRKTRISKMWLPPGTHDVTFNGDDRTSSASILVSWRDAYRAPR